MKSSDLAAPASRKIKELFAGNPDTPIEDRERSSGRRLFFSSDRGSDGHAKNFSLRRLGRRAGFTLRPYYDILSVARLSRADACRASASASPMSDRLVLRARRAGHATFEAEGRAGVVCPKGRALELFART